jgi:hypothetical protein
VVVHSQQMTSAYAATTIGIFALALAAPVALLACGDDTTDTTGAGASSTGASSAGGSSTGGSGQGGSATGGTSSVGGSGGGGGSTGGAPPGADTDQPFPIDMGDAPNTPGSYKGLPLRLTDNGEPSVAAVNNVIGVVCIGMSNSTQECSDYIAKLGNNTLTGQSAQVKVVDCAVGGNAIERWNDTANDSTLWDACINNKIGQAGVSLNQVRVVYHKAADQFTTMNGMPLPAYPASGSDYANFIVNLTTFAGRVTQKFPNLQAVYTTSRMYGGFATSQGRGEPLSYEEGHALNTWLANNTMVSGVWFGWGPYIWGPDCASGDMNASGVCYVLQDFQNDGVHPAQGALDKIAPMIHARFLQHAWYAN